MSTATEQLYLTTIGTFASPQAKRSFENIKNACDTLEQQGVHINAAAVGKECVIKYRKPTAGSIRNNKIYMTYIRARADEAKVAMLNSDTYMPRVMDPTTDAYIAVLRGKLLVADRKDRKST